MPGKAYHCFRLHLLLVKGFTQTFFRSLRLFLWEDDYKFSHALYLLQYSIKYTLIRDCASLFSLIPLNVWHMIGSVISTTCGVIAVIYFVMIESYGPCDRLVNNRDGDGRLSFIEYFFPWQQLILSLVNLISQILTWFLWLVQSLEESVGLLCISKISGVYLLQTTYSMVPKNILRYYCKAQVMLYTRRSSEH